MNEIKDIYKSKQVNNDYFKELYKFLTAWKYESS